MGYIRLLIQCCAQSAEFAVDKFIQSYIRLERKPEVIQYDLNFSYDKGEPILLKFMSNLYIQFHNAH